MKISSLLLALIVMVLLLATMQAASSQTWVDRAEVAKKLAKDYAEVPVGMGLANNGGVVELFSSKYGATWTLIVTMPNGESALITSGEYWETPLIKKIAGKDS